MSALIKAGQTAAGNEPKTGRQDKLNYDRSFDEKPTGVVGDEATKPGTKHKEDKSSGETVDEEVAAERKEDAETAASRGEIPDKSIKKAFSDEGMDLLKSMLNSIETEVLYKNITKDEFEFLTTELGYTAKDVAQGRAVIKGFARQKFSEWLINRADSSVDALVKSL